MDVTGQIKQDSVLRHFLLSPEMSDTVGRSFGFAAMRLMVAVVDAVQMVVVSVFTASAFFPHRLSESAGIGLMGASLALAMRRGLRPTTNYERVTINSAAQRAGLAIAVSCSMMLVIITLVGGAAFAIKFGPWIASWGALSVIISYTIRALPIPALRRITLRALQPTVAVVGAPASAQVFAAMLVRQGTHLVTDRVNPDNPHEMRRLEQRAGRGRIDKVIVVGGSDALLDRVCLALADTPTLVCVGLALPTTSSLVANGLTSFHPPLLPVVRSPMSDWRGLLKRLIDLVLVIAALPFITPLLLLVALAIRVESRGPVLFRQWRFGLGSKPTQIIKFRTMYHDRGDSTGEARTVAYDPRVTVVGRFLRRSSIDELPQLFNVLRGDMSLVGPRPHATHMKVDGNYYFEAVQSYRFRHRVKPGITGWAQITGSRGEIDSMSKALERVEKDLWYVQNWSLALDFEILAKTLFGRFASLDAD